MTEQKMIDEMIDLQRKYDKDASPMLLMINTESRMNKCDLSKLYTLLMCETMTMFDTLYAIGKKFDFSMEDVYEAYKKKNKTNLERLASNY